MNSKYKPGFYFGILTFIFNLVIIRIQYPNAPNNWLLMLASALIGGLIGGLLFDGCGTGLKKGKQKIDHLAHAYPHLRRNRKNRQVIAE